MKTLVKSCSCPKHRGLFDDIVKGFDRHDLEASRQYLGSLRSKGRFRRWDFQNGYDSGHPNRYCGVRSTAFEALNGARGYAEEDLGVYLDAGCGSSADAEIALKTGYSKAYGVDLFEPFTELDLQPEQVNKFYKTKATFIKGDICEPLPIEDNSLDAISSNWVVPLMCPADRLLFYRQAFRMLKVGGYFSLAAGILVAGYNHKSDHKKESDRVTEAGFKIDRKSSGAFVAIKPLEEKNNE